MYILLKKIIGYKFAIDNIMSFKLHNLYYYKLLHSIKFRNILKNIIN